jgi:hypothetical protein
VIASLFAAGPALAQTANDPMRVEGSATLGGIYNRQSVQDATKLEEYRDLGNGVLSSVFIRGRNSTNWFDGYGENFGRDDQYMFLRGGIYDVFKAGAYLNDIPHNFALGARTPYSGTGTSTLIANFPNINPDTWNTFDLGYKRRDAGGYFEWQKTSPWYFRVDGNEVKFSGTKVGSGANGTSPGNGFVDLAFPTQYKTANFGVEGGYQTGKATLSLRWDYSRFDNSNETLNWTNRSSVRTSSTRRICRRQYVQQVHVDGQLSRFAVALGGFRAVHMGANHEQRGSRPDGADHRPDIRRDASGHQHLPGEHVDQSLALSVDRMYR